MKTLTKYEIFGSHSLGNVEQPPSQIITVDKSESTVEQEMKKQNLTPAWGFSLKKIVELETETIEVKKDITEIGANAYKISWFSLSAGNRFEEIIKADTKEEAIKKFEKIYGQGCLSAVLVESDAKIIEHIAEAEELLYEMDANKCDAITLGGGLNGKSITHTRKEVEAYLKNS